MPSWWVEPQFDSTLSKWHWVFWIFDRDEQPYTSQAKVALRQCGHFCDAHRGDQADLCCQCSQLWHKLCRVCVQ